MIKLAGGLLCILALLFTWTNSCNAQMTTIDYRFAPPYWYSAIGFPADHHKTLLNDNAALLYDFGPGPYVKPGTRVFFVAPDSAKRNQFYGEAKVPIVTTVYSDSQPGTGDDGGQHITAYALPPSEQHAENPGGQLTRINGLTGTLAWANPPDGYDPAFRNVAWGTNRPIEYQLRVDKGARKRIAIGFCESYRNRPGMRNLLLDVDGADPVDFDPLENGEQNEPQVVVLDAIDDDGDGVISLSVQSSSGDPNTVLNAVWVFADDYPVDESRLLRGDLSDKAEIYIDAGREPQVVARPSRFDVLRLQSPDGSPQTLRIETRRTPSVQNGVVMTDGFAFVKTDPKPNNWRKHETGIDLVFDEGNEEIVAIVQNGFNASPVSFPTWRVAKDLTAVRKYWLNKSEIPTSGISVPDTAMQNILDASIRTVYQMTEAVDDRLQAQPGAGLYRGVWMHDAVYFIDLMTQLGDTETGERLIDGLLTFQHETGQVEIMRPSSIHRETPLFVWLLCRYAELIDSDEWLAQKWDRVRAGIGWMRHLRQQTLVPGAPNYGLTPSGFADGGIHGVQPEYASVNWMLIALSAAIDAANRLEQKDDAEAWQILYNEFLESFEAASSRDVQHDEFGNAYLPIRVGQVGSTDVPQRAQWMLPEALSFGKHISPNDSLVSGTFKMLETNELQGLVESIGWLDGGVWGYFGGMLAEGYLRVGEGQKAADLLYAMANHASPVFTWPEEQMPVGGGRRTAGDFPHAWSSSTMPRLVIRLLAFEDGKDLTLLRGIPKEWLAPSSQTRLKDIATRFGRVDISVDVSTDGDTARIEIGALPGADGSEIRIDWSQFHSMGFSIPASGSQPEWGSAFSITLIR